nr:hypothetical protein Iba_chr12cCG11240 [Ipomoea batatas]
MVALVEQMDYLDNGGGSSNHLHSGKELRTKEKEFENLVIPVDVNRYVPPPIKENDKEPEARLPQQPHVEGHGQQQVHEEGNGQQQHDDEEMLGHGQQQQQHDEEGLEGLGFDIVQEQQHDDGVDIEHEEGLGSDSVQEQQCIRTALCFGIVMGVQSVCM